MKSLRPQVRRRRRLVVRGLLAAAAVTASAVGGLLTAVRAADAPEASATSAKTPAPAAQAGPAGASAANVAAADLPALDGGPINYNRDIRPILSDNCFHCHGNDKHKIKGKLLLNDRDAAIKRKAIVPGKPDDSSLVERILSADADDLMPPPESQKTLSDKQKALLKRWVAEGAEYQPHWAYITPVRPPVPAVGANADAATTATTGRNPIDAFVRAELLKRKMDLSLEADRRTLLRRLSLDLVGLPPTPAEVDAFVADKSPGAYEKQVDRLMASPHYGERMAVPWLDAVRYADTVGYHGDQNQNVFPYRDYVINAFNHNKPFDVFTAEQLAGDLMPDPAHPKPTQEQLVASGFNRLNMMTREGGAQAKEYLAKYQADRVRTVSMTWLGSTFGCAECHDHKFDPISAKDFYSLSAFFADVRQWGVYADYSYTPVPDLRGYNNDYPFPPEIKADSPYLAARQKKLEQTLNDEVSAYFAGVVADAKRRPAFEADVEKWAASTAAFLKANPTGWQVPELVAATPKPAAKPAQNKAAKPAADQPAAVQGDKGRAVPEPGGKSVDADAAAKGAEKSGATGGKAGSALPPGFVRLDTPMKGKVVQPMDIALKPTPGWVATVRLEVAGDLATAGATAKAGVKLSAGVKPANGGPARKAGVYFADADFKEAKYRSTEELVGVQDGWKLSPAHLKQRQASYWLLDPPLKLEAGDQLVVSVAGDAGIPVRVSTTPLASWNPLEVASAESITSLKVPADKRTRPDMATVCLAYLLGTAADADTFTKYKALQRQIADCRDGKAWTQVTVAHEPMVTRVLNRGNWQDETGEIVPPLTPHFFPGLKDVGNRRLTRLDLAKWLTSAENPLTSRVVANRFWKQFFGTGLCASVEDVGLQGEWPSHPELLDWLAVEFRQPTDPKATPWDVKRIVRLIVTSKTYRQQSNLPPALRESDPGNRLLAAQSPRRLEAEFVRDNALAAAGLLNLADVGGPSVKPYQPEGYYAPIQFPDRKYIAETDEQQYRRGVYMHWQRTFLHPMLANFDAPSREDPICARVLSNTPQQALTLLNDPEFVEASRVLAEKVLALGGTDELKLEAAYQRVLSRSPKANERASLLAFLAEQRKAYKASPDEAAKLVSVGNSPASGADVAELAAWANTCRVVLNLHEAITRY
jgi:hypothetical protein